MSKEEKDTIQKEEDEKKDDIDENEMTTLHERAIAALSYVGPLAIIPFYLKKDSKFCRFHGKQGLVLTIAFFIAQLLTVIDFVMDLFLILQVAIFFWMGLAALSGKWKKMILFYEWGCKLEDTLSLKTKEEEEEEAQLKPDQVPEKPKEEKKEESTDSKKEDKKD